MQKVLKQPVNGVLQQALEVNDIHDVETLCSLKDTDIESLTYPVTGDGGLINMAPLTLGSRVLLRAFRDYMGDLRRADNRKKINFYSLAADDFDDFRVGIYKPNNPDAPKPLPNQSVRSATADFRKGIKRDKSQYDILREDKQWDDWRRSTIATARSHDCEDIFDPNYTPADALERAIFKDKQSFMYSVFERVLKTDTGKALVRKYEADYDAQQIFIDLTAHATTSTQATLDADMLLAYLTTARVETHWKGSSHAFILHWCNKMRSYEDMLAEADHFTPSIKMRMLQNAVAGVSALNQVKVQSAHAVARGEPPLEYEPYKVLLLSAATTHDAGKSFTRPSALRKIREHELYESHDITGQPSSGYSIQLHETQEPDDFTIDTDISSIQAYSVSQAARSSGGFMPRMSRDKWKALSSAEQQRWDEFSPQAKATILGIGKRPDGSSGGNSKQSINLHAISAADFLQQMNLHDSSAGVSDAASASMAGASADVTPDTSTLPDDDPSASGLMAMVSQRQGTPAKGSSNRPPPGDLRRVLGGSGSKKPPDDDTIISLNGKRYRQINVHKVTYHVSQHKSSSLGSLIDCGANGGLAGADVRVIHHSATPRTVDVSGIDGHQITNLPLVTAGGVVQSQRGPVIAILHQYAYTGQGKTIHSSAQLEWFKNEVHDRSLRIPGGQQCLKTADGYIHLLQFRHGLPYLPIRPYTDDEWDSLPHVVFTSDADWDPSVLDDAVSDEERWYDAQSDHPDGPPAHPFDAVGDLSAQIHLLSDGEPAAAPDPVLVDGEEFLTTTIDQAVDFHSPTFLVSDEDDSQPIQVQLHEQRKKEPDYESLRPFFLQATADIVKRTFNATTQYARSVSTSTHMKKAFRSPFPALNVHRRQEPVATDTVYSDEPAIDDGSMAAQLFIGRSSLVTDVYGVKTDQQFVSTLEDNIRRRGAMDQLVSDRAQAEVGNRTQQILRAYCIDDWQSEPHHQHQNHAERRWGVIKPYVNLLLKRTGAPASTWLLALLYVVYILNRTATASLDWRTPLEVLTGTTPDISPMLQYQFWEPVYYKVGTNKPSFPSEPPEKLGRFVGMAETVGHAMTFKVLTDDTQKVIYRSVLRSARHPDHKPPPPDKPQEEVDEVLKSKHNYSADGELELPTFDPADLIGRTFLLPRQDDGQRFRAEIVEAIVDGERNHANHPVKIRFRCTVNDEEYEDVIAYNELLEHISKDETEEGLWRFKSISAHQGPLSASDPDYRGSRYNVLVEWETGESTFEPLNDIAADDPITCAIYAKDNDLLDEDGWRRFKPIARRQQKLLRLTNQAKLQSYRSTPVYKFGYLVPRNHDQAMELDRRNGNTKWADAEKTEVGQLFDYETFFDLGKGGTAPKGHKKIRCHIVYDVKHDGRHKARLVAGGHLTDTPVESVYSSVVSLKGLRLVIFLAELNGLEVWATDVGNAYLEAHTKEKVYVIAGPEFGDKEGHTLVFNKALYGLKSSGLRWHERFADTLRDMGFFPSKAEDDIWMRRNGDVYEYIATYVDDLAICAKDPQAIVDLLTKKYKYKLKGTGAISYHLGCDYFRDSDGVLCAEPRRYIEKMMDTYQRMFGSKPREASSPLEKGDHPELDTSEELNAEGIKQYQSLIGALQWAISLGRMDITTAVMSMSSFRAAPRVGHLDRLKRIYGYLGKMKHATIRIRTGEPDYSDLPQQEYDWTYTVYGNVQEKIPDKLPEPLGKPVTLTTYVDANLYHDMATGRSVSGILHLINQTPFDWYSKKQSTVETATYGSEFIAAWIATDQLMDHRTMLCYLGVTVCEKSFMFGDNQSVVTSSTIPHSKLHKRHTALSYHRVREAIASGVIVFAHIFGNTNPADILSKHWAYPQVWPMLQALLFHQGDTMALLDDA